MDDRTSPAAAAAGYHLHHRLSSSREREDRVAADEWFWSWERVWDVVHYEADLRAVMELLDALVHESDEPRYLDSVGAGPIEDLLNQRPDEGQASPGHAAEPHPRTPRPPRAGRPCPQ